MKEKIKSLISKVNYDKTFKCFFVFMVLIIFIQLMNIKKNISDVDSEIWDLKREIRSIDYSINNNSVDCPNVDFEVDCLKSYDLSDIERKLDSIDIDISLIRSKIGY